jgi:LDH2 family malate/lactate/ureidoglycolate dehydrogenase
VPAASGPVTMDMATAAYAWFGVLEAKTAGKDLPPGVAMNAAGEDTRDPSAVLEGGALKVFDSGHKGSALALFVELLAGPLVGAAVADKLDEKNWGNLVVAIQPSLLQVITSLNPGYSGICAITCSDGTVAATCSCRMTETLSGFRVT